MIEAKNIRKVFKSGDAELIALKNISFEIKNGEFLSIIGRSGSGKSTLLYQLGLLDKPTSGTVILNGIDTAKLSNDERTSIRLNDLGYVFQDYALIPELTALENVVAPLMMQGLNNQKSKEMALQALDRVGLKQRLNHLPNQLSGGEQQRVSIARAIGHNPKILFADEPTANLDNVTSLTILDVFKELHKQGQTIILVTHEEEYTKETDRIITLFDGEIVTDKRN